MEALESGDKGPWSGCNGYYCLFGPFLQGYLSPDTKEGKTDSRDDLADCFPPNLPPNPLVISFRVHRDMNPILTHTSTQ